MPVRFQTEWRTAGMTITELSVASKLTDGRIRLIEKDLGIKRKGKRQHARFTPSAIRRIAKRRLRQRLPMPIAERERWNALLEWLGFDPLPDDGRRHPRDKRAETQD